MQLRQLLLGKGEIYMVRKVILRQMGGSIGATTPKNIAERFNLSQGDEVFISETDQGMLISPYDPNFNRAMAAYEEGAKKFRNALRELSK